MTFDELLPRRDSDPLIAVEREDLDPLSLEELTLRVTRLNAEILRAQAKIESVTRQRANADALFRR